MTHPCRHAFRRAVLRRLRLSHELRAVLSALSCAVAVSACATASEPFQPAKEAIAMTTPDRAALIADTSPGGGGSVPTTRHPMLAAVSLVLALLISVQAFASGHIGPFPIMPQEFRDFSACKAYLEQQHASDQTAVGGAPAADGFAMPKRSLETKGVVQTGDSGARYEVELGYLSKVVQEELELVRSQYSYERRTFACNDGMLTGTAARGYHIETYEPLE